MSQTSASAAVAVDAAADRTARGAVSGTIGSVKASAALKAVAGMWIAVLPSGEALVEVAEDGKVALDGLRVGSQYDVSASFEDSTGKLSIGRGDGWAVDMAASKVGRLVWTKPGEDASVEWVRTWSVHGLRPSYVQSKKSTSDDGKAGGCERSNTSTRSSEGAATPPRSNAADGAAEIDVDISPSPAMSEPSPAASDDEALCDESRLTPLTLASAEMTAAVLKAVAGSWISAQPSGQVCFEVAEDGRISMGGQHMGSEYDLLISLDATPSSTNMPVIRRRDGWAVDMKVSKVGCLLWKNTVGEEMEWLRMPNASIPGGCSSQTEEPSYSPFSLFRACSGGR